MHTHGPGCLQGPVSKDRACWRSAPRTSPAAPRDEASVRRPLVDRVRKEIAAGTYDTPDKFEAALDRLLAGLDAG